MFDYKRLMADYASYHLTEGNQNTHTIGIPLIVFAIVKWTQLGSPIPLAVLVLPVYFMWSRRLGWIMAAVVAHCAVLGYLLPGWTAWVSFIVGWGFQIYGHEVYEKNRPALLDNLTHALIGPAFVIEKLAGKC